MHTKMRSTAKIAFDLVAEMMKVYDDLGDPVVPKEAKIPDDQRALCDRKQRFWNSVGEGL